MPHYACSITFATCLVLPLTHYSSTIFCPSYMFLSASVSIVAIIAPYCLCMHFYCNQPSSLCTTTAIAHYYLCLYCQCNHSLLTRQVFLLPILITTSISIVVVIVALIPLYKYCHCNCFLLPL